MYINEFTWLFVTYEYILTVVGQDVGWLVGCV